MKLFSIIGINSALSDISSPSIQNESLLDPSLLVILDLNEAFCIDGRRKCDFKSD